MILGGSRAKMERHQNTAVQFLTNILTVFFLTLTRKDLKTNRFVYKLEIVDRNMFSELFTSLLCCVLNDVCAIQLY